jgi:hypothetical protein
VRYQLYVERRVSSMVYVDDAPDLATAIETADMPGETDDVDTASEWEVLYAYGPDGEELPLPVEVAGEQEGDRMFWKRHTEAAKPRNGFGMGPGTGPVITPKQRVARARKLRAAGKGTKARKSS